MLSPNGTGLAVVPAFTGELPRRGAGSFTGARPALLRESPAFLRDCAVSSAAEHLPYTQGVAGSNPAPRTRPEPRGGRRWRTFQAVLPRGRSGGAPPPPLRPRASRRESQTPLRAAGGALRRVAIRPGCHFCERGEGFPPFHTFPPSSGAEPVRREGFGAPASGRHAAGRAAKRVWPICEDGATGRERRSPDRHARRSAPRTSRLHPSLRRGTAWIARYSDGRTPPAGSAGLQTGTAARRAAEGV